MSRKLGSGSAPFLGGELVPINTKPAGLRPIPPC